VTLEQVTDFLQDEKIRPFILDIETDSTIAPDENAQKQRVTEYLGAMGSLLSQALPAVQQLPQAAPMLAEMIRFAQKQFRVGRSMDQVVDEFATSMQQLAQQPPPDPNAGEKEKQAAEVAEKQMRAQSEAQRNVSEGKAKELEGQAKVQETGAKAQSEAVSNAERVQALQAKDAADKQALADKQAMAEQERVLAKEKHDREMEKIALDIEAKRLDVEAKRQARVTELMGQGIKSVPGEPSEEGGEPVESLINIADERQAETNAIMAAVAQGLAALAEAQAAPKQIAVVRDAQGRMIGAKEL
jgi:bacterioferritin-associated ferredoxin